MEWKIMELKSVDSVNLGAGVIRKAQVERNPSPTQVDKQAVDMDGGVRAVEYTPKKRSEIIGGDRYTGKQYDYTLNADHDLVIKVKERDTNKEIRQIPSKEAQAYRRAFRAIVDKLLDIKV